MIELPEAVSLSKQLSEKLKDKTVINVSPPLKQSAWFSGDPKNYAPVLNGKNFIRAEGLGIFVEMHFAGGVSLCVNDGITLRYYENRADIPGKYQLLIEFSGQSFLCFNIAMYGGIFLNFGDWDYEYYIKSKSSVSPLSEGFNKEYFFGFLKSQKESLSLKAVLATGQRIPGLGNGCLQDILFRPGLNPKRKVGGLCENERAALFDSVKSVLKEMAEKGGRSSEKDIFGKNGGYKTVMSKDAAFKACPGCGENIVKEAYLGGAVYYCPVCQKI